MARLWTFAGAVLVALLLVGLAAPAAQAAERTPAPKTTAATPARTDNTAKATSKASPESSPSARAATEFAHPGVFVGLAELKTSKEHVKARDEPWITIFRQLAASPSASRAAPNFTTFASASLDPAAEEEAYAHKRCNVNDPAGCVTYCGSYNQPDIGCTEELADARAVYGQALMYWYTGKSAYAQRAIAILNAYAKHFTGNRGSNGPLMTAWVAEMMLRGAEILRYTYTPGDGETAFDVAGFSAMLRKVFVTRLQTFDWSNVNGNWSGSAADGLMNAGVFLDDRAIYNVGIAMWRERVPTYLYLSSDGDLPHAPPGSTNYGTDTAAKTVDLKCWWLNNKADACLTAPKTDPGPLVLQNGQSQESCRDFGHVSLGIAGIVSAAETAHLQGDDLYGEQRERIMTSVSYLVQVEENWRLHKQWPKNFCKNVSGLVTTGISRADFQAEVVYNAYAVRERVPFQTIRIPGFGEPDKNRDPLAAYLARKQRSQNAEGLIDAWDTLTHHLAAAPIRRASPSATTPSATRTPSAHRPSAESPTEEIDPTTAVSRTGFFSVLAEPLTALIVVLIVTLAAVLFARSRSHR
ncbi:alginate lyase family protein [Microbacterium gorillae]|uniref:alginate lyase family protein n=1 Tax=Microbacterium gorillae TaxID=1231063 RepID=UPI00058B5233|nr:alginate lyase family protein [Microbacterium gorillae]